MANPEHLRILNQGLEAWNKWRQENPEISPDLTRADLTYANLTGADLSRVNLLRVNLLGAKLLGANLLGAKLLGANLTFANLHKADLRTVSLFHAKLLQADLTGADLTGADLTGADFSDANLSDANLSDARLPLAKVSGANLIGTNLSKASFSNTILANIDLSEVIGLESAKHDGPSTIGIDTFFRSKGKIPQSFLRGAGVPDIFLEYATSLAGQPLEFYSCFISYSTLDIDLAERLRADLRAKGVRCWFFPEDAKWGEPVWGEIDRGIKTYDKLVVVCSQNSLQSPAVLREIERALQREDKEKNQVLFPIRIDDYIFDGWENERKADVVRKVVGDFTRWKNHDAYRKAFDRLLRDLKAAKAPPPASAKA